MRRLRLIKGWKGLPQSDRGAAVAMGTFDGVHRGHQQVIALAAKAAGELGAPLGVITFDQHPRAYFRPHEPAFQSAATVTVDRLGHVAVEPLRGRLGTRLHDRLLVAEVFVERAARDISRPGDVDDGCLGQAAAAEAGEGRRDDGIPGISRRRLRHGTPF